jgi:MFS family permease
MACMFITAGIFPNIILQTGCFFLAGLATSALFVTTSSTVQLLAPSHQKSTILGLFTIVTIGAQPLAALWWGALLDQIGVPALLILVGSVQAILSILMLCQKRWITWSLSTNV